MIARKVGQGDGDGDSRDGATEELEIFVESDCDAMSGGYHYVRGGMPARMSKWVSRGTLGLARRSSVEVSSITH